MHLKHIYYYNTYDMGLLILLIPEEIHQPGELRRIMRKEKVQVWGARQKPFLCESGAFWIEVSGPIVNGIQDGMVH